MLKHNIEIIEMIMMTKFYNLDLHLLLLGSFTNDVFLGIGALHPQSVPVRCVRQHQTHFPILDVICQ
jgi:hypothetical protein